VDLRERESDLNRRPRLLGVRVADLVGYSHGDGRASKTLPRGFDSFIPRCNTTWGFRPVRAAAAQAVDVTVSRHWPHHVPLV